LQLARSVRAEPYEAPLLFKLFRGTALAASVLLASALAGAVYLSQRTKAAAHEAMVLDHVATWPQPAAFATDPVSNQRQSDQQLALAQWIADDLQGRQEE
jgi:hypothetical protein